MSDVDALSERIDALEMRLTYQDVTIETLNQTITAQWVEIDTLTRQIAELKERLQDAESNAPGRPTNRRRITEVAKRNGPRGGRSHRTQRVRDTRYQTAIATAMATITAHTTGRDLLGAAAARRVVGGVVEFGLHRRDPAS